MSLDHQGPHDPAMLDALTERLKTLLPEEYQECYDDVQPVSMGSAGLKYDKLGAVAWDEIWGSFCDLAMAGGPPHKGKLLEPASASDINAQPDRYQEVTDEICRGVNMVTDLPVQLSPLPGWVRVDCGNHAMAEWLVRAIVMENVAARCDGPVLDLPAGPDYRVEKEIKNVVTAIAKTCHYWQDHMWSGQHRDIANLFARMSAELPLIQPALVSDIPQDHQQLLASSMAETIHRDTGLRHSERHYPGWFGVECPDIRAALWMMRALVASNVLARREDTILFVPINPTSDPSGEIVARALVRIHRFAMLSFATAGSAAQEVGRQQQNA